MTNQRIYGIDLGTTNSLVAFMDDEGPRVVPDPESGSPLLPSVVYFPPDGEPVVGHRARAAAAEFPHLTIASVKRFMGRGIDEVDADDRLRYPISPNSTRDMVRFNLHGRDWTPTEISALILRALRQRVRVAIGDDVRRVVITVPAYFDDSQRQATRDAGRLAGLEVLRLVNEPTAASLAYGLEQRDEATIAVYDFGGGTFDISLLRLRQGIFEVVATAGNTRLGGDDIDHALAEHLLGDLDAAQRLHPAVLQASRAAAERAKIALTTDATTTIRLSVPSAGLELERMFSREEFEALAAPVVEATLRPCRRALKDAGLSVDDIDEVVLVGGSTRSPLVRRRVGESFARQPHCELDPDQVVALGAAVQGGVLSGRRKDVLLLDVVPLSLGIETVGGLLERVIDRNTTIPVIARQVFTTFADNQTAVDFHVLQGERELARDNRSLARFQLRGIEPRIAGVPRIEVTFTVDANGILNVAARDEHTGREQSVDVKPSYGLTDEDVERMLEESFDHAEDDVMARLLIAARTEAESILRVTRTAVTRAEPEELVAIEAAISALETSVTGTDHDAIRGAVDHLNDVSRPLAQRIMDASVQEALARHRVEEF